MTIAHINFSQGSFKERITHSVPVNTSVLINNTNLCRAARFTATADLDTYGVVSGVKSVVMAIRPSANTKLLQDDGSDRFEITGGNFSGTGMTECTVSSVDSDAALLGQWQLVIAEFSAGINFATDLEIDPTAILDVAWIVLDDTILTTAEKDAYYQDFLNTHGNQEVALKTIGILQVDREWEEVAPQLGAEIQILSLAVHNERLFGGTYPNGKLYRAQMTIGTDIYPLVDTLVSDDLLNANADGVTQTVFIDQYRINSGTFRNKEDATGKYRECVTDGSISLEGIDLSDIVGNGYIKELEGDLSGDAGDTIANATNVAYASNKVTLSLTAGQVFRKLLLTRGS